MECVRGSVDSGDFRHAPGLAETAMRDVNVYWVDGRRVERVRPEGVLGLWAGAVGEGGHGAAGVATYAALHWEGQVDYRRFRKVEFVQEGWKEPQDATYRKEAIDVDVMRMTRNVFLKGSSAVIQWSDLFVGANGDGVERSFDDFRQGELIRYQHQVRHTVESVASAVVHDGCFSASCVRIGPKLRRHWRQTRTR